MIQAKIAEIIEGFVGIRNSISRFELEIACDHRKSALDSPQITVHRYRPIDIFFSRVIQIWVNQNPHHNYDNSVNS